MTPKDYSQAKVYAERAKKKYEDPKKMSLKWHKKSNECQNPVKRISRGFQRKPSLLTL